MLLILDTFAGRSGEEGRDWVRGERVESARGKARRELREYGRSMEV
jgi:hypothetical protein